MRLRRLGSDVSLFEFDLSLLKYHFSSGKPPCVHLTVKVMQAADMESEVAASDAAAVEVQPTAAPAAETAAMAPAVKVWSRVHISSPHLTRLSHL